MTLISHYHFKCFNYAAAVIYLDSQEYNIAYKNILKLSAQLEILTKYKVKSKYKVSI